MENNLSRKDFLKNTGKYAAGVAVGVTAFEMLTNNIVKAGTKAAWPFTYKALDVEKVRILGHDSYLNGGKGCAYGAFHSLMENLRTVVGDPYTLIPSELMLWGGGGGNSWGTLCGALNSSAVVISLVCDQARASVLINELFGWYTQVKFPTDMSNQCAVDHKFTNQTYDKTLAQTVSGSPLCHSSVSIWCKATSMTTGSTERKERCARLTGDVAAYTAQILNDEFAAKFKTSYVAPESIATCMSCHGAGTMAKTISKMECKQCHGNMHATTSAVESGALGAVSTYKLHQNYPNPFNPTTKIRFSIPEAKEVYLSVYDAHGRLVRELVGGSEHAAGTYELNWDGLDDEGQKVASGVYFSRIQAGSYSESVKMVLLK
ncbi:MAG: C-GCAxxG-C-C family (seleno)protein [Syntrophothermus sp.]